SHRRMPVIWSGNGDGVHILLLENRAKIFLRLSSVTHLLLHAVSKLLENVAVHVAHMRNSRSTLVGLEGRQMSVGAAIQTNNGKVQPVIGAKNLGIALGRCPHGQ